MRTNFYKIPTGRKIDRRGIFSAVDILIKIVLVYLKVLDTGNLSLLFNQLNLNQLQAVNMYFLNKASLVIILYVDN